MLNFPVKFLIALALAYSCEWKNMFAFLVEIVFVRNLQYFILQNETLKLRCDSRFQRAFTACSCVFKVITLIGSNQGNYFENPTTCSKRMRKTLVATQL